MTHRTDWLRGLGAACLLLLWQVAGAEAKPGQDVDWLVHRPSEPVMLDVGDDGKQLTLSNGLIARTWRIEPNSASISYRNLVSTEEFIRAVRPEAILEVDGHRLDVGGLVDQPDQAYIDPQWLDQMGVDPLAMRLVDYRTSEPEAELPWEPRFGAPQTDWPPKGLVLTLEFELAEAWLDAYEGEGLSSPDDLRVSVHYAMYQDLPVMSTWVSVEHDGDADIVIERMTTEQIAMNPMQAPRFFMESDYAFHNMVTTRWTQDPQWNTRSGRPEKEEFSAEALRHIPDYLFDKIWEDAEVRSYGGEGGSPALVHSRYNHGPAVRLEPGDDFKSFVSYQILHDSDDEERRGLARREMYRKLAPWTQENPIFMHIRHHDTETVRNAIDQCAEVGFEMLILSFWSGFNMLTEDPAEIERYRELFEYANERGVKIGGYILFASSANHGEHNALQDMYGPSLCLGSAFSDGYFQQLYDFIDATGMDVIETDGPYHGYPCNRTDCKHHDGFADSFRVQWERQNEFYRECVKRGMYINVPDYYFFTGANKGPMGYRERNWSLPRELQVLLARQDIYDGTFEKTATMGWMLLPLVEYQGGGPGATIEPLRENLDVYEAHLAQNFGTGVMAAYRGPRLYDAPETKELVKRWVDFYKDHRRLLDSNTIHVRRPDGRDIDCMMKVNPELDMPGMVAVYNPLDEQVTRELVLPLYYTGLSEAAVIRHEDGGTATPVELDSQQRATVEVTVPARGRTHLFIERAE